GCVRSKRLLSAWSERRDAARLSSLDRSGAASAVLLRSKRRGEFRLRLA
uniref:Uncharacterized protein n=1 Tax=Cucumis melo TaxID=3656 RepID=A0A9I9E419_CUCME